MGILDAVAGLFEGIGCLLFGPSLNELDYDIFYLSQIRREQDRRDEEYFEDWADDCDYHEPEDESPEDWWR